MISKYRINIIIISFLITALLFPSLPTNQSDDIFPEGQNIHFEKELETEPQIGIETNTRSGSLSRADAVYESASEGLPTASPSGGDSGWTGIDFGDFNNDGFEDIVVVGRKGNGPEPYISDGKGKWTYSRTGITSTWSGRSDVRLVDINNDDNLDIVSSDSGTWLGDGTGKWTEASQPAFSAEDVAVGDFNNDNKKDIALIGHLSGGIKAYYGDGKGNWIGTNASNGLPTSSGGHKINFADVNNDDNLDIIASYWYDESVWLGDGKGNWTASISGMAINNQFWGVATGDVNKDDNIDIALTVFDSQTSTWGICLYKGDGNGNWQNGSTGLPTTGSYGDIELADMNNDGYLDVVAGVCGFGSGSGSTNIWFGDGNFQWTNADVGLPQDTDEIEGLDVGDMDNDGYLDIGIPFYGEDGVQVWRAITPEPVYINVTSPNGGEKIRVGTEHTIKWHAVGGRGPLKARLEYSINGEAGPYLPIADGVENTGEYTWTTPLIESTYCYVKISVNDSTVFHSLGIDISNASFELYKVPINKVVITPVSITVIVNDNVAVEARSFDTYGAEITGGVSYTWVHKGAIGTLSVNDGTNRTIFSATKIGKGTIRATANYFGDEVSAEVEVTVPQTMHKLKMNPSILCFVESNSYEVNVVVFDIDDTIIDHEQLVFNWVIKGSNAKITSDIDKSTITIKALDRGEADLEVKVDYYNMSLTLTRTLEVFPKIYVFGVTPVQPVVKLGETLTFTAAATGVSSTDLASLGKVEWKLDSGEGFIQYSPPGISANFTPDKPGRVRLNATLYYLDDVLINITEIFVPHPLDRIRVEPDVAFIHYGDSMVFNITAYDKDNFKIHENLKVKTRSDFYLGDTVIGPDGHSFEFTAYGSGQGTLTVTAEYYGYNATTDVEITIPPAIEFITIEPSKEPIFTKQVVTLTAKIADIDGVPITKGLEYSWIIPEEFSNIFIQDSAVTLTPLSSGEFNITLDVGYFGKTLKEVKKLVVIPSLDSVTIELSSKSFSVNEQVTLTARAIDTEGNAMTGGIEFTWESTGGSLDKVMGENVKFKSKKEGTFTIKVTATLSDHRDMTASASINVQVKPAEDSGSFMERNSLVLAGIAIVAVVVVSILLFLMLNKRRAKKRVEEEKILVPQVEYTPGTWEAYPQFTQGTMQPDRFVNFGDEQQAHMSYPGEQPLFGYDRYQDQYQEQYQAVDQSDFFQPGPQIPSEQFDRPTLPEPAPAQQTWHSEPNRHIQVTDQNIDEDQT